MDSKEIIRVLGRIKIMIDGIASILNVTETLILTMAIDGAIEIIKSQKNMIGEELV